MTLDLESALFVKLSTTAAISALVGNRIYPFALPPTSAIPAITYQVVTAIGSDTHDETPGSTLAQNQILVIAYATSYAGAIQLAKAIFSTLQGFKGVITSGTDNFTYQAVLRTSKRDDRDSETGLFWRTQEFSIWAQE